MTEYEVLELICEEKIKLDKQIKSKNDLTNWFWKVGFKRILINEQSKKITCIVSRPNKFIEKYRRRPIINFLNYLVRKLKTKGYFFELKKDDEDMCFALYQKIVENMR